MIRIKTVPATNRSTSIALHQMRASHREFVWTDFTLFRFFGSHLQLPVMVEEFGGIPEDRFCGYFRIFLQSLLMVCTSP